MTTYKCEWCGKEVEVEGEGGLPEGWIAVDYDSNKYTQEVDDAEVCSQECEMRLAERFAAGGLK